MFANPRIDSSLKDAVRVLNGVFSTSTVPLPLSEETQQTIDFFLDKHEDIEDHDSAKLQEELLSIYYKYVVGNPEKHGLFVHILKKLRPAITGEDRWSEWWALIIRPTVDAIGHKRDVIEDARDILLSILVYDSDEDDHGDLAQLSLRFTDKLLDAYLSRARIPTADGDGISPEDEFVAHELETVLLAFGRKKPKEFLIAVDDLLLRKDHRAQALSLLCSFVRAQPPHLHLVLQTPLIQHLEKCLMIDTSATVVYLALTILIMFLPHITSALVSHLPKLFLIYYRILCWEKFAATRITEETNKGPLDEPQYSTSGAEFCELEVDVQWEKLYHTFDNSESTPPELLHYFTFLYGLFPLHFMSFIRKPRKLLKTLEFPGAQDLEFDQDILRKRTEPFRQVHLLHPNFCAMTIEDELSESRWLRSDPADVVTECMGLCVAVSASLNDPGPPPTSKLPDIPEPKIVRDDIPADSLLGLDDESTICNDATSPSDIKSVASWRNTQSTVVVSTISSFPGNLSEPPPLPRKPSTIRSHPASKSSRAPSPSSKIQDPASDSPTLPPKKGASDEGMPIPSLSKISSSNLRKDNVLAGSASVGSPPLEAFAQTLSQTRATTQKGLQQNLAALQREVMLLRNDLNFERYLKLQHLSHIGQLQRRHIREATVEAETQNLINTNRTLKAKLAKANELYAQLRKETTTNRNQSKRWEGELSTKVRGYRDEHKTWLSEEDVLSQEVKKLQKECERLKKLLADSESRELQSEQKLRSLQLDLNELDALRQELETLHGKLREYELRELEFDQAKEEMELLRTEVDTLKLRLNAANTERERARRGYERKITELETRVQSPTTSQSPMSPSGHLPSSVQSIIDSALAAERAKYRRLDKINQELLSKTTELDMKVLSLQREQRDRLTRQNSHSDIQQYDGEASTSGFSRQSSIRAGSNFGGSYASRVTRHRALSEEPRSEEDEYADYHSEYQSPSSMGRAPSRSGSSRPMRYEHLQGRQMQESLQRRLEAPPTSTTMSTMPAPVDFAAEYEANLSLNYNATSPLPQDTVKCSNKSSFSVETTSSKERERKDKITPKSEVRVYGRGGAQNIGKKPKDKDKDKGKGTDKPSGKTGGFRGLKGIM
ncbi:hypothetical protein M501DRAFT_934387 [Patellaria atrata CBS 101060]|uniref:Hamartin n=1 Tax=Patellaria atrata CBS 101060 TaxID=1346257 RepID=A0A9P4S9U5_9PEZI|nr:hypothetical protein M501DRAFT_934387 [Patellaria atrata CBS 101060]